VVPWHELEALVEPHYPKAGNGRRPVGLKVMLRAYFVQQLSFAKIPSRQNSLCFL
jgi:IS5 family transposase